MWRRNRWGLTLLLFLLVVCALLRLHVDHMRTDVDKLKTEFMAVSQGSLQAKEILPATANDPMATRARIQFGQDLVYDGILSPEDTLSWSGKLLEGTAPAVDFSLNGQVLGERKSEIPAWISISTGANSKRTISLAASVSCTEKISLTGEKIWRWRGVSLIWSLVCASFSALAMFAIFGAAEPHSSRGFTGLPPRQFTLPVTTTSLVLWPIVLGATTSFLSSLAWTKLVFTGLADEGFLIPHLYFALLLTAGLSVFQALVWGLPSFPKTRIFLICVLILTVLGLSILPLEGASAPAAFSSNYSWIDLVLVVFWMGGVGGAWFGVNQERQGRWSGWTRSALLARAIRRVQPRPLPFASEFQALLWFEWRRNGRLPLLIWIVLVWLILATQILAHTEFSQPQTLVSGIGGTTALIWFSIWMGLTGLNLARDGATKRLALSTFSAVRPVTTGKLLQAKLCLGAILWLAGLAVLGAGFTLAEMESGAALSLVVSGDLFVSVMLIMTSLHLLVGILPFSLSGRLPGFPWSLLPLLLTYGVIVNGIAWFDEHPDHGERLFDILILLLFVKLGIAVWGFRRAIGLGLSSISFVFSYAALWLIGTSSLIWCAYSFFQRTEWNSVSTSMLVGAALIIPLARVALSPLTLAANRNR